MTSNQDSKKENTNQETSTCLKGDSCHWVIEPPNGPTSLGKCKKCGKEKEFRNSFEYNTWHGEKPVESKNNSENYRKELFKLIYINLQRNIKDK